MGESELFPMVRVALSFVVKYRIRLVVAAVSGAFLFGAVAFFSPRTFRADATVVVAGGQSGSDMRIRSIASQFGFDGAMSAGGAAASPQLLARIALSANVLERVWRDSAWFASGAVGEAVLAEALRREIPPNPTAMSTRDRERVVTYLRRRVAVNLHRETQSLEIVVVGRQYAQCQLIAQRLIDELDAAVAELSRSQASAEREFVERRLAEQEGTLASAERAVVEFVDSNRDYRASGELALRYSSLAREVDLRKGVVSTLQESLEQARIREVRDTPVLTVVTPPADDALPQPRGTARAASIGALFAVLVVMLERGLRLALPLLRPMRESGVA